MKLDYSFDRQLTLEREDSRAEGLAEGREEGLEEGRAEGLAEGLTEGRAEGELIGIIKSCKHWGKSKEATMDYLIETYHLTKENVTELINRYWDNV